MPFSRGLALALSLLAAHASAAGGDPRTEPPAPGIACSRPATDQQAERSPGTGAGPEAQAPGYGERRRADDLSGTYRVEGREPSGRAYSGEALVVRRGDIYHIAWKLGTTQSIGTGLVDGNVLAVAWMIRGLPIPGVAVYEIAPDGALAGRYTVLGADAVGEERWTPVAPDAR